MQYVVLQFQIVQIQGLEQIPWFSYKDTVQYIHADMSWGQYNNMSSFIQPWPIILDQTLQQHSSEMCSVWPNVFFCLWITFLWAA